MILRFEKEYTEKREDLDNDYQACVDKFTEFKTLLTRIKPILVQYGIGDEFDFSNSFVDNKAFNNPVLRIYLNANIKAPLSNKRENNLIKKLREAGAPMPICPFNGYAMGGGCDIHFVYTLYNSKN